MKLSRVSLFLFIFNFFYLFLRIYIFPYLYNSFGKNAVFYILILLAILIIFILIIPKSFFKLDLKNKSKKWLLYLLRSYFLIRMAITLYLTANLIQEIFFSDYSTIYLSLGMLLGIFTIVRIGSKGIIDISTFFYLLSTIIIIITFFDIIPCDFSLLLGDYSLTFDWIGILIMLPFIFDIIILILFGERNLNINKKSLLLPIILSLILIFFEYYLLYLAGGEFLFKDYIYVGFVSLSIQKYSIIVGNVGALYIFLIIASTIFKQAFLLSIFDVNNKIKIKIIEIISVGLLILLLYFIKLSFKQMTDLLLYFILGFSIFIPFIIKEISNARKTKEK